MKGIFKKLFGSKPVVTVVSGLPRSGTSMMMKMLEAGGIPPLTDKLRTADDDNPKGYYEFERVKQMDKGDTAWMADAQGKTVKVISQLLKFMPSAYEYKVIFMRRNMSEILASQKRCSSTGGKTPMWPPMKKSRPCLRSISTASWIGWQPSPMCPSSTFITATCWRTPCPKSPKSTNFWAAK
jgi:hypothetical protein